jgi:hypothetical protein
LKDFAERYPDNVAINYNYALSLWDQEGGQQGNGLDKIEGLLHKAVSRAPESYEPHFNWEYCWKARSTTRTQSGNCARLRGWSQSSLPRTFISQCCTSELEIRLLRRGKVLSCARLKTKTERPILLRL